MILLHSGVFEYGISLSVGVLATLATLIVFHRFLSPKIQFSECVRNVYIQRLGRHSYSVKIQARGWFDLVDTRVMCQLSIQNVRGDGTDIWNHYNVPTTFSDSLRISSASRIIHLNLRKMKQLGDTKSLLTQNSYPARPEVGYRFEDFFMQFDRAYIQVQILGHDSFSGVKKLYLSPRYGIASVRAGRWNGLKLNVDYGSAYA